MQPPSVAKASAVRFVVLSADDVTLLHTRMKTAPHPFSPLGFLNAQPKPAQHKAAESQAFQRAMTPGGPLRRALDIVWNPKVRLEVNVAPRSGLPSRALLWGSGLECTEAHVEEDGFHLFPIQSNPDAARQLVEMLNPGTPKGSPLPLRKEVLELCGAVAPSVKELGNRMSQAALEKVLLPVSQERKQTAARLVAELQKAAVVVGGPSGFSIAPAFVPVLTALATGELVFISVTEQPPSTAGTELAMMGHAGSRMMVVHDDSPGAPTATQVKLSWPGSAGLKAQLVEMLTVEEGATEELEPT